MNNLVVQLLLKTGTFSTDLKTARGQIQNFQQGCQTAGKSLTGFGQALGLNVGSLAKFGGAVGAAVLAGKELKNILDSSQTTSDSFQSAIAGCKGVIEQFRTSIATFDFSSFKNGLWDVFDAAKAVQEALDQLGNTQIAYDFKSKQNQTKFQEAYNVFKDPQSTAQMKEDAKKQMKEAVDAQFAFANNYSNSLYKTYVAQVVKKAGSANLNPNRVTLGQFEKAMNIDIGMNGDPEKARAENERQYREYLRKLKEYGKNNIVAQDNLKKQYADVIAIHSMLELMKDDELKGVAQLVGGMEDAKQVALSMQKTMNRAISGSDRPTTRPRGSSRTTAIKEEEEYDDESIVYWDKILKYEQEHLRHINKSNKDWETSKANLKEAQEEIRKLQNEIMGVLTPDEKSYVTYKSLLSAATELRDSIDDTTPEWEEQNQKVLELESIVSRIEKKMSLISMKTKLEEALAISPATEESLETIVSILTQLKRVSGIGTDEYKKYAEDLKKYQEQLKAVRGVSSNVMKTPMDSFTKITSSVSTLTSGLYTLSDAFAKISGNTEDTENEFKKFLDVVQTCVSVFQAMASIIQTVNSLQELFGATAMAAAGKKVAADTMSATSTTATATTEVAANTAVAASGAAASQAAIPIVGPALAIAAAAAVIAAIIAAISSTQKIQRFANGGIVGGSSFTGDRVSAQVNSGEMILNKTQQANLFKLANGGGTGKEVTFHISGTDLVGVMNNINRKNKVIR